MDPARRTWCGRVGAVRLAGPLRRRRRRAGDRRRRLVERLRRLCGGVGGACVLVGVERLGAAARAARLISCNTPRRENTPR